MYLTRYPDSPILSSATALSDLADFEWMAQFKMDGWRCVIELGDESARFISRHDRPLPVSSVLAASIGGVLREQALPGSIFDAEFMGRRDGQPESIIIFDVLRSGFAWMNNVPLIERFALLYDLVPAELIVAHTWRHYAEFFEASRRPGVEGIVLKHINSKYIASPRRCAENYRWLKVRHRAGDNGQVKVA